MIILDFYGVEQPEANAAGVFLIEGGRAGPDNAEYEAVVIGAREYRINLTPVVLDADGAFVAWPQVQVAHNNPAPSERKRNFGAGEAEHFTTTEAGTNGLQLGGGSKIGAGGPVDRVWVHGRMPDGGRIRSEVARCGLYSADIVLSPVFQVKKRGAVTPPPPAPPPFDGSIAEELTKIEQATFNIRQLLR